MGASVLHLHREFRSRRWSSTSPRQRKRQAFAAVLFFFAGSLTLLQWRTATLIMSQSSSLNDSTAGRLGNDMFGDGGLDGQCAWHDGAPMLYRLKHPRNRRNGGDWFDVAELFIGRRAEFKNYFPYMQGAHLYIQDSETSWTNSLTPMTRLLLAAGLSSVGVESIHFIDGTRSSFSYPLSTTETLGGVEEVGVLRGGGGGSAMARPQAGQVGVLHMDQHAYEDQFVVSTNQPLWERLVVSEPVLTANWGVPAGGGVGRGGAGGGREECVKYIAEVGRSEQKRDNWFPTGPQDARSLQMALNNFCPIYWLEDEDSAGAEGDGEAGARFSGQGGGPVGRDRREAGRVLPHYNSKPRKVVIYQRDRNRRLLESDEVANELWERLGNIGWSVVELVHDPDRHPCEVVAEVSSADVLLTTHGFQSMLALFMRPGTVLFEVFPHKYFKEDYQLLAQRLGMRYGSAASRRVSAWTGLPWFPKTEACMEWSLCRWYAGSSDVKLHPDKLEILISMMLDGGRVR